MQCQHVTRVLNLSLVHCIFDHYAEPYRTVPTYLAVGDMAQPVCASCYVV